MKRRLKIPKFDVTIIARFLERCRTVLSYASLEFLEYGKSLLEWDSNFEHSFSVRKQIFLMCFCEVFIYSNYFFVSKNNTDRNNSPQLVQ